MFKRSEVLNVSISEYAFGGKGVVKIPTESGFYIVLVDNAFPGQVVKARIVKKRKKHAEAKLIEVIKRSPVEKISDFQEISGAPYIYVPINEQEKQKKISTLEIFRRIGNIENPKKYFDEFISSPKHFFL